jgi:hypothetical protein
VLPGNRARSSELAAWFDGQGESSARSVRAHLPSVRLGTRLRWGGTPAARFSSVRPPPRFSLPTRLALSDRFERDRMALVPALTASDPATETQSSEPSSPQDTSLPVAPSSHHNRRPRPRPRPRPSKRPCARLTTCPPALSAKANDAGKHVERHGPRPAVCSPGRSPPAERELDGEVCGGPCGATPFSYDDSLLGVSLLRELVRDSAQFGHTGYGVHTSATAPAERAHSESAPSALVTSVIGGLKALLQERRAGKRLPDDAPPCSGPRDVVSPLRKRLRCQPPSHGPCEGEGWHWRAVHAVPE